MREFRGRPIGEILDRNKGVGLGFDLLRLGLAVLILLSHTSGIIGSSGNITAILNWIFGHSQAAAPIASGTIAPTLHANGEGGLSGLGRPVTLSYLPMFFALSGFLVTGSALRTRRLIPFLGLRVLRLIPALMVEVFLSAVILGAAYTTLPLGKYYTSAGFWDYFQNIIGHVHFFLPGVFEGKIVNANLWTLPWEFYCYFFMSFVIISSLLFRRLWITIAYAFLTVALIIASLKFNFGITNVQLGGPALVYYFMTGMMFHIWRDKIIFHEGLFLLSAIICYPLMLRTDTLFVYPIFLTYVTVFIGVFPFPQFKILKTGDYSYGIYLYGFPVTQALVASFPGLKGSLALAAVCAVVTTSLFAAMSWHLVEKHCLKLKRFISPKSAKISEAMHSRAFKSDVAEPGNGVTKTEEAPDRIVGAPNSL